MERKFEVKKLRKYMMFIMLVVITILFQILTKGVLLTPSNITKLILQNSYIIILAIGMLPVILTGNVDLSVGSSLALVSAIAGKMIIERGYNIPVTIIVCLLIGLILGAWHGFWVSRVKVPAFIATLSGLLLLRGLTISILDGNTLAPFPKVYTDIASGFLPQGTKFLGISISGWIILAIAVVSIVGKFLKAKKINEKNNVIYPIISLVVAFVVVYILEKYQGVPIILIIIGILVFIYSFILRNTTLGRSIYATGSNEEATKLSGIDTRKILFLTYVNMGLLAAAAGITFSGRLGASTPTAGDGIELDAIAACYIGGASASGGIGTISGAIIGALIMGILNNGMSIMGVGTDWQQGIKGFVLLFAVAFDMFSRRKENR